MCCIDLTFARLLTVSEKSLREVASEFEFLSLSIISADVDVAIHYDTTESSLPVSTISRPFTEQIPPHNLSLLTR